MKFKSLLLTAALTAASFSGVANAAIEGRVETGQMVDSDLVFFMYDKVKDLSYVQNLDVHYNTIVDLAGSFSGSYNLDASLLNIFSTSTSSDLVWGMLASGVNYNDPDGSRLGTVISAASYGAADWNTQVLPINDKFAQLAQQANLFTPIGTANASAATGAATSGLSAAVGCLTSLGCTQVPYDTTAGVNTAQSLWFVHATADYDIDPVAYSMSANTWSLSLANNTLSSAAVVVEPPVATPLPAAAWLMVSALMGLGGIARRRNAKV